MSRLHTLDIVGHHTPPVFEGTVPVTSSDLKAERLPMTPDGFNERLRDFNQSGLCLEVIMQIANNQQLDSVPI